MNEQALKDLWQSSNEKMEMALAITKKNAEEITKMKVESAIATMKPTKKFTLLLGIVWVGLGSLLVVNLAVHALDKVSLFFLISAGLQLLITAIALVVYVYQLVLIHQVDSSQPILETQDKLARLKSSTLWITRVLFLQLPLWTTFFWSERFFTNINPYALAFQISITTLFAGVAIWLFVNIRYENRHKKWFHLLFSGKEWNPVMRSIELLEQIKEYKNEATT